MLQFYRRVTVECETPTDNNVSGVVAVHQQWLYQGKPIGLGLGGSRHIMTAKDVRIEHIIEAPEDPQQDRSCLVFKSADGRKIDSVSFHQSWIQMQQMRRYYSQSFPVTDTFELPEDASIIELLTIEVQNDEKGSVTIYLKDYLERQRAQEQSGTPAE
uniref:Uncharacterized protein n=1 Tax=Pseudomonas phage RVTF4 TaxID=3236931 RepID=A0AB39CCN7_9VIRU